MGDGPRRDVLADGVRTYSPPDGGRWPLLCSAILGGRRVGLLFLDISPNEGGNVGYVAALFALRE